MERFFKISDAALIALHATVYIAKHNKRRIRASEIADYFMISEAHLSKILQRLTRAGYIKPYRGPLGGYEMLKDSREISLLDIYELIEGKIDPVTCLVGSRKCPGEDCLLGTINKDVYKMLTVYLKENTVYKLRNKLFN